LSPAVVRPVRIRHWQLPRFRTALPELNEESEFREDRTSRCGRATSHQRCDGLIGCRPCWQWTQEL